MPKLHSPFTRKMVDDQYVVINEVNKGYEWVFDDNAVVATEKLDGTNVSVLIEDGIIKSIWNRTERVPFFNKGKQYIIHGIQESYSRGYLDFLGDGQHFGELIGAKVNGNRHEIKDHIFLPFDSYVKKNLVYESWNKYPKDFDSISKWFKESLFSLYHCRIKGCHDIPIEQRVKPEGIVFYSPDGRMAKLRRDMFDWYEGRQHKEDRQHKEE